VQCRYAHASMHLYTRARTHTHTVTHSHTLNPTCTQFCSLASSISSTSSTHDRPKISASQQRLQSPEREQAQMVSLIHSHARPRIMQGLHLLGSGQVVQGGGAGAEDECVAQAQQRSLSAHAFAPSPPVHRHNVVLAQAIKYRCEGGDLVSAAAHAHRGVEGDILGAMPGVAGRGRMPGPAGSKTKLRTTLVATKGWGGLSWDSPGIHALPPSSLQLTLHEAPRIIAARMLRLRNLS
jgi:hypothetical protein